MRLTIVYSMQLSRANLVDELVGILRGRILDGSLPPGRINEVHVAADLGVSRTPLREALMRLVPEGAVTTVPRIGFFVQPLCEEELEQLYPLRAILDPAALRLVGIPSSVRLKRLREINRKLAASRSAEEAVKLDDEWHFELIDGANPILKGFIEQLVWRTRRYELGLMKGRPSVANAVGEHDQIIKALEDGDLGRACELLAANLSSGKQAIVNWLRSQGNKP